LDRKYSNKTLKSTPIKSSLIEIDVNNSKIPNDHSKPISKRKSSAPHLIFNRSLAPQLIFNRNKNLKVK